MTAWSQSDSGAQSTGMEAAVDQQRNSIQEPQAVLMYVDRGVFERVVTLTVSHHAMKKLSSGSIMPQNQMVDTCT